ncbi:hypothetical protein RchiOBHm_Chr5g0042551 [Rosa chinensis]|uniref:Uncharacterized protein n=1 Tax=Rosa chinensis TaxID=74649 RepID=A0A2P6QD58_ROSCH|nr:hypothetical protein RchiOBHm_Chr5g0042551 [Rosa chinensis]
MPYALNLTTLVVSFNRNQNYPDFLVIGSGLQHMLHLTNASDYGASLQFTKDDAGSLVSFEQHEEAVITGSVLVRPSSHLFWIGIPTLINSMLNTDEKRDKITDVLRVGYDE